MKKNILAVIPMEPCHRQALEKVAPDCEIIYTTTADVTREQVESANIILGNVPAGYINASEKLELLQLNSAGTDAYTAGGVLGEKTVLTNATGAYGKAVAEHMFGMMFMLMKKLHLYRDHQNERVWKGEGKIRSITDMTVLVVGLGDIGLVYARMCKALGAHTIGVKRRPGVCPEGVDEMYLTEDLEKVLPMADAVVSFLPGTPQTTGIFNKRTLALMKPGAILLNGGRGGAIITDDLIEALNNGVIAAAGLDVTDPEPLPVDNPLWKMPNVLITPHVAGGFNLDETLERIIGICIRNVSAILEGREPENIVDMQTGYKK